MSKISIGTVQFGLDYGINNNSGKQNHNEVKSIFDYAYNNNINFLLKIISKNDTYQKNTFQIPKIN